MNFEELQALDQQYVMQTYGRFPAALDHGKGATLWDVAGKEYIDFASGIGVNSVGYGNEAWQAAIREQAAKLGHVSNLFYSAPYIQLAQRLCQRSGMSNAFFANGGGEANEGMIKLARKYSFDKYGKGRGTVLTLNRSFHGRTITTLAATGQEVFHNYFFPFTEGFRYADANDLDSLEGVAGHDVCAVMVELGQGEGGVLPLDILTDQALDQVKEKGEYLRSGIEALGLPCLGSTRGLGLMIGVEVKDGYTNKELAARLVASGLLVLTAGPALRLLPPLVITREEMDRGLTIMKAALS